MEKKASGCVYVSVYIYIDVSLDINTSIHTYIYIDIVLIYLRESNSTLERVKAKFTVKFPVCSKPKTHAYGVFDCEFDYDSQNVVALNVYVCPIIAHG